MELYFLRHGLAGQHGDPRYKDDSLRPLTDEGKEKMRRASLGIKALGVNIDVVLSSPYLRAKETAEIFAEVCKPKEKKIHFTDNLLPPATARSLIKEISERFADAQSVVAVGHEPQLSQMISELIGSDKPLEVDFKKGGLCCVAIEGPPGRPRGTLKWLLVPSQMILMK